MAGRQRKRGATRTSSQSRPLPGWLWLLCGILITLIAVEIAPALYDGLKRAHLPHLHPTKSANAGRPAKSGSDKPGNASAQPATHFDFYKMLPKFQVVIPDQDIETRSGETTKPIETPGTYVLQVGSFQSYSDADRLKANLALLGVEASIQQVTVDNGQTWNRVRIGPIHNLKKLNDLRVQLRKKNIEPMIVRIDK